MIESLYEKLERISKIRKKADMVAALRAEDSYAVKTILQAAFDPRVNFILPPGVPPYKPNDLVDQENVFFHECRKLVYFVEGGAPNLTRTRREAMFIELLECVDRQDSLLLLSVVEKKLPWKTITKATAQEAFPEIFA